MDTARNGTGRLVERANRQGPWRAPGQRSIAGPGIREFWIRYFVNSDSTSEAERMWSASYVTQAAYHVQIIYRSSTDHPRIIYRSFTYHLQIICRSHTVFMDAYHLQIMICSKYFMVDTSISDLVRADVARVDGPVCPAYAQSST